MIEYQFNSPESLHYHYEELLQEAREYRDVRSAREIRSRIRQQNFLQMLALIMPHRG